MEIYDKTTGTYQPLDPNATYALATAARYSAEHFAQQVLDAYQQAIALKRYESEHKSILSWV